MLLLLSHDWAPPYNSTGRAFSYMSLSNPQNTMRQVTLVTSFWVGKFTGKDIKWLTNHSVWKQQSQNRIQIHGTRVQSLSFPSYLSEVSLQWRLTIDISVQFSLVAQSCPTLCDSVNHSTPGLPVHHQLPESTQTHVHWVGNTIQPSDPLLTPSPPAFSLS